MALRSGTGGGLSSLGHAALAAAVVATVLFGLTWMSLTSCQERSVQLLDRLQETEHSAINPAIMERQNVILQNLTARLQTAESALKRLQQIDSARQQDISELKRRHQAEVKLLKAAVAPVNQEIPASGGKRPVAVPLQGAASTSGGGENKEDEEDEKDEPSEEDEEERQKKEYEEQLALIEYNPNTKTFTRWRPDFKCGDRAPMLPDETVVECNPKSDSPCCSSLGWCGTTKLHCRCGTCVDYRRADGQK